MCSCHMLLSFTDKPLKPHLLMYEYYLISVTKSKVSSSHNPPLYLSLAKESMSVSCQFLQHIE